MSKSRLVSGKVKKLVGSELDSDRSSFLNLANAEPDLGLPTVDESILVGDTDGTRTWIDITTYAEEFKGYTGSQGVIGFTGSRGDVGFTGSFGFTGSRGDVGYTGSQGVIGFTGSQGDIGFTGSQGVIGFTGSQGVIGFTGSQGDIGFTGSQGVIGFTGSQGDIGFTGSRGDIGFVGSQGPQGNFGGVTFDYTFDSETSNADPGAGKLRLNNAAIVSAMQLYIHNTDDANANLDAYLTTIDDSTSQLKGHVRISNKADSNDFAIFSITGISTNNTTYFTVPVAFVSGTATGFNNLEDIIVTFARTGDKGDIGFTGSQGFIGFTGSQGDTGYTGSQGVTGYWLTRFYWIYR